jgi:hypothetical protein
MLISRSVRVRNVCMLFCLALCSFAANLSLLNLNLETRFYILWRVDPLLGNDRETNN